MSIRAFSVATLAGLALVSSLVAAVPASAHQWNSSGDGSHRSERYGRRDSRDGWYDSYGTYHRYDRHSHSRRS
jgi:hypothetical protein